MWWEFLLDSIVCILVGALIYYIAWTHGYNTAVDEIEESNRYIEAMRNDDE